MYRRVNSCSRISPGSGEDTGYTGTSLSSGANISQADTLTVKADGNRTANSEAWGGSIGAVAVGASIADATLGGSTNAYLEEDVRAGRDIGMSLKNHRLTGLY